MTRKIEVHLATKDIDQLTRMLAGDTPFAEIEGSSIQDDGFDAKPLDGYVAPENFPDCCKYHRDTADALNTWFDTFPNCCDRHRKLSTKPWFKKENYSNRPLKTLNYLSFFEHALQKLSISNEWHREVTDYLEYLLHSFGTPDVGADRFTLFVLHYIEHSTAKNDLTSEQRSLIAEYLEPTAPVRQSTDFNQIHALFLKWLSTFPNLDYFSNLRNKLQGKFPINLVLHQPEYNKYLGVVRSQARTKSEFIDLLVHLTKKTLLGIDTTSLSKGGGLSGHQKMQIDLLKERHRLRQRKLAVDYSDQECTYVDIIDEWLANEQQYFTDLSVLLKEQNSLLKMFEIEKRTVFGKDYVKLFWRDPSELPAVRAFVQELASVHSANITANSKQVLTIYPSKTFTADDTMAELSLALVSFTERGSYDPVFNNGELSLSNNGYNEIIDHINQYGINLEKQSSLISKLDEEGLRAMFLPHLNLISKGHSATGETFNKHGKTDILIQDNDGNNVFLAECKIWKGESELRKAIDQLMTRYVGWRDTATALIVFNKNVANFTTVISNANTALQAHPLFHAHLSTRSETSFRYMMKSKEDNSRLIRLELVLFNFYAEAP